MFRATFYPSEVKIYEDNVCASVTNSLSAENISGCAMKSLPGAL